MFLFGNRPHFNKANLRKLLALCLVALIWLGCGEIDPEDFIGTPGDIAYCGSEAGVTGFTGENALKGHDAGLKIAWPTTGSAPHPVVMLVPGIHLDILNYFMDGDVDYFDSIVSDYTDAGMVAISINYRQDNIVEMYEDVACAVRWVKAHAQTNVPMYDQEDPAGDPVVDPNRVEMDPDNIVLVGHSIGGYPVHLVGAEMEQTDFTGHPGWHAGYSFTEVSNLYTEEDISTAAVATVNSLSDILASMSGVQWGAQYNPLNPNGPTYITNPVNSSVVLGPYCTEGYFIPLAPYVLNYVVAKEWLLAGMEGEDFLECDDDNNLILKTDKLKYVDMLNIQRLYHWPAQSNPLSFDKPYATFAGAENWAIPPHNSVVSNIQLLLLPERNPLFTNTVTEFVLLAKEAGGIHELVDSPELQAALFDFVAPTAGVADAIQPALTRSQRSATADALSTITTGIGEPVENFCVAQFGDILNDTDFAPDRWNKCVQVNSLASALRLKLPEPPTIPTHAIRDLVAEAEKPKWIDPFPDLPDYPTKLELGRDFACLLNHEIRCWGNDISGGLLGGVFGIVDSVIGDLLQLGWNPETDTTFGEDSACVVKEGVVECVGEFETSTPVQNLRKLAVTNQFACGINSVDNGIHCWGSPPSGQPNIKNPLELTVGDNHVCAIDYQGKLSCWGDLSAPDLAPELFATQIVSGRNHACAVVQDQVSLSDRVVYEDKVYCWNNAGPIATPALTRPTQLAAGNNHTCAIFERGVECWGNNGLGQLNVPDVLRYDIRPDSNGSLKPTELVATDNTTCAVVRDDDAICWGDSSTGLVGVLPLVLEDILGILGVLL